MNKFMIIHAIFHFRRCYTSKLGGIRSLKSVQHNCYTHIETFKPSLLDLRLLGSSPKRECSSMAYNCFVANAISIAKRRQCSLDTIKSNGLVVCYYICICALYSVSELGILLREVWWVNSLPVDFMANGL